MTDISTLGNPNTHSRNFCVTGSCMRVELSRCAATMVLCKQMQSPPATQCLLLKLICFARKILPRAAVKRARDYILQQLQLGGVVNASYVGEGILRPEYVSLHIIHLDSLCQSFYSLLIPENKLVCCINNTLPMPQMFFQCWNMRISLLLFLVCFPTVIGNSIFLWSVSNLLLAEKLRQWITSG